MTTTRDNWRRVGRGSRCPVCDHADWCLISADGSAAICPRVESPRRVGDAGWLHRLKDDNRQHKRRRVRSISFTYTALTGPDLGPLAGRCREAVDAVRLLQFADSLGLSVESLCRLGVGWCSDHNAWTFPMTDSAGNVVGIRLRRPNGFKFAVTGGKEGLFIPSTVEPQPNRLLVSEGPTDTAALLDLGFNNAVGRPK